MHVRVMHGDELGVTATGEERHHALPGRDVLAGALEAGDVGRGAGRRRVTAGALHQVGAVHAGRAHPDHDLALAGDRIGPLLDPQAPIGDDGGTHSGMLRPMKLEGVHHVTCITGDAPANVEFYAGTLGLRMVKKTVNQDDPTVYHLFYADERGSAGSDITFFEYPGAPPGRAGDGMVHRVCFRVGSEESLDFWHERVGGERAEGSLVFADQRGALARAARRRLGRGAAAGRGARHSGGAPHPRLRRRARVRVAARAEHGAARNARVRAGLDGARRQAQRLLRLRRPAGAGWPAGSGHRAPRRVGLDSRRSTRRGGSG